MMILGLLIYSTAVTHAKSNIDDFCKNKTYGSACQKENKPGVCVQGMCFLGFKPTPQPTLIKIRYPQGNEYVRNSSFDGGEMFLRGDGLGLTWTRGRKMRKLTTSDTWELELQFAIPGYELPTENKPAARFEFRVYLEDSLDMLGPNFVIALPLSTNAGNSSKTAEFWRYPWFFSKEGSIVKRNVYSPEMRDTYEIVVSLPPSFRENTYKRYEVLIVNDGQRLDMLLPQLKVLMLERALIKEIVLVGIANDYRNRTRLLAVSNGSELACLNGGDLPVCNGCLKCNSSTCDYEQLVDDYRRCYMWVRVPKYFGQLYLDFIQNTIIPDSARKYRTLPGAENVGILGFSLGGLMACHAIWTRPQTFGSAACMSPSLWWPFPQNATFPDDAGYEFTTSTLLQHRGARPRQKIYIDVGGREGEAN